MKTKLKCTYEVYPDGNIESITTIQDTELDAFKEIVDNLQVYLTSDDIEDENMTVPEIVDKLQSMNGDGCDYIIFFENRTTGDVYIDER